MKRMTKILTLWFCVMLAVFMTDHDAWGLLLSFNPPASTVMTGDTFDLEVVASLTPNEDLAAFDLNINYDETILSYNSYELGDWLGDIDMGDAVDWSLGDFGGGVINLAEVSLLSDFSFQPDDMVLATVNFTGDMEGISPMEFMDEIFGDPAGVGIDVRTEKGAVRVIPEPAAIFLLWIGLIALSGLGRRGCKD